MLDLPDGTQTYLYIMESSWHGWKCWSCQKANCSYLDPPFGCQISAAFLSLYPTAGFRNIPSLLKAWNASGGVNVGPLTFGMTGRLGVTVWPTCWNNHFRWTTCKGKILQKAYLGKRNIHSKSTSSWWLQIFFIFPPTWGNDPIWLL